MDDRPDILTAGVRGFSLRKKLAYTIVFLIPPAIGLYGILGLFEKTCPGDVDDNSKVLLGCMAGGMVGSVLTIGWLSLLLSARPRVYRFLKEDRDKAVLIIFVVGLIFRGGFQLVLNTLDRDQSARCAKSPSAFIELQIAIRKV